MDERIKLIEKLTKLNGRISNLLYVYLGNVANVCERYHYLENKILSKPDDIKEKHL